MSRCGFNHNNIIQALLNSLSLLPLRLIIIILLGVTGNFIEIPSPATIEIVNGVEVDAVFRCRHQCLDAQIGWLINGSFSVLYRDVVDGFTRDNGTRVDTLTIPAIPEYNGTEVVCIATFFGGSPDEVIPPADLIIIGMVAYRVLVLDDRLLCLHS